MGYSNDQGPQNCPEHPGSINSSGSVFAGGGHFTRESEIIEEIACHFMSTPRSYNKLAKVRRNVKTKQQPFISVRIIKIVQNEP